MVHLLSYANLFSAASVAFCRLFFPPLSLSFQKAVGIALLGPEKAQLRCQIKCTDARGACRPGTAAEPHGSDRWNK